MNKDLVSRLPSCLALVGDCNLGVRFCKDTFEGVFLGKEFRIQFVGFRINQFNLAGSK